MKVRLFYRNCILLLTILTINLEAVLGETDRRKGTSTTQLHNVSSAHAEYQTLRRLLRSLFTAVLRDRIPARISIALSNTQQSPQRPLCFPTVSGIAFLWCIARSSQVFWPEIRFISRHTAADKKNRLTGSDYLDSGC
eukprot:scaffold3666_cov160-Amphora_coffeaeformis.AAC.12